jgi:hypothetical protein
MVVLSAVGETDVRLSIDVLLRCFVYVLNSVFRPARAVEGKDGNEGKIKRDSSLPELRS